MAPAAPRAPLGGGLGGLPTRAPTRTPGRGTTPPPGGTVPVRRDAAARQDAKLRLLAKLNKVRPMSAAAQRVLALTASIDADVGAVADVISSDPALATETLRISNSAVYRRAYPIDDLRRAVMTLGLEQVRSMATAMALLSTVSSDHPLFDELHATSLFAATLAGLLTTELFEVEKNVAFVAGLLCEMGAMACLMVDDDYAAVHRAAQGDPVERERLEADAYGMTTWEVGGRLLRKNHLSEAVVDAVGASLVAADAERSQLTRITVFSRTAAPFVLAADRDGNVGGLRDRLEGLGKLAGLEIGADTLVALCDWALSSASLMRTR